MARFLCEWYYNNRQDGMEQEEGNHDDRRELKRQASAEEARASARRDIPFMVSSSARN
jgi:hypothetical protein